MLDIEAPRSKLRGIFDLTRTSYYFGFARLPRSELRGMRSLFRFKVVLGQRDVVSMLTCFRSKKVQYLAGRCNQVRIIHNSLYRPAHGGAIDLEPAGHLAS